MWGEKGEARLNGRREGGREEVGERKGEREGEGEGERRGRGVGGWGWGGGGFTHRRIDVRPWGDTFHCRGRLTMKL